MYSFTNLLIKYIDIIKPEKWTSILQQATNRASTYAHCIFDYSDSFDLIFVDGRRRVECCLAGLLKLSDRGVIVLHDSYRKQYKDILMPYIDIIENGKTTLVFKKQIYV
jgi:hypothetical protein